MTNTTRPAAVENINLDMLAYDIADILDRGEYGLDITQDEIRAALPEFLAAALACARADQPSGLPERFAAAPRAKSHGGVIHTCNGDDLRGLGFGRRDAENCARCWELDNGAEARPDHVAHRRTVSDDEQRAAEIRAHSESAKHRSGGCGIVCTFGDW